jgi:hypothetical protein
LENWDIQSRSGKMKKTIVTLCLVSFVVFAGCEASKKPGEEMPPAGPISGTIQSVDTTRNVVIVSAGKEGQTVDVTAHIYEFTKITLDGKPAEMGELQSGQKVICYGTYEPKSHAIGCERLEAWSEKQQ